MRGLTIRLTLLASLLFGCAQLGCASLGNYYGPRGELLVVEDLVYVDEGDPKHALDLYVPQGVSGFPTVVFVHGGWWNSGDRRYFQPVVGLYGNIAVALARRGIAVANISYRLHPQASLDDMLDDVAAALRFVQTDIEARGGDPEQLFLSGHSAGGHLVALLGAAPDELSRRGVDTATVRGVAALSPPLRIASVYEHGDREEVEGTARPLFGDDEESIARASPLSHLGPASLPLLVVIGSEDLRGIVLDYDELGARKSAGDLDVALHKVAGADHGEIVLSVGTPRDEVTDVVARWILERADASRAP